MAKTDVKLIQKLRNITGLGMLDCKKALDEAGGDIDKAIELLRKRGAAIAAKREGKKTSEGLVHSYIHPGGRVGVLVEISCETDFVARTDELKQFAKDLGMHIAALKPLYRVPEEIDPKFLEHEKDLMREQLADSGKPDNIVNQIVEGKLKKLYSDICLFNQQFVKNDQLTIEEVLQQLIGKIGENIKIKRFARFEIGA